jgi:hypothetical protein
VDLGPLGSVTFRRNADDTDADVDDDASAEPEPGASPQ